MKLCNAKARRVPVNTAKNPNGLSVVLNGTVDGAPADVFIGFAPGSIASGVTQNECAAAGLDIKSVFANGPLAVKPEIDVHADVDDQGVSRLKISTELTGTEALARLSADAKAKLGL